VPGQIDKVGDNFQGVRGRKLFAFVKENIHNAKPPWVQSNSLDFEGGGIFALGR
jgi:hypothetical protein